MGKKVQDETMFVISSHAPKIKMLAKRIREHWGIENRQHWVLDVTFSEDQSVFAKRTNGDNSESERDSTLLGK